MEPSNTNLATFLDSLKLPEGGSTECNLGSAFGDYTTFSFTVSRDGDLYSITDAYHNDDYSAQIQRDECGCPGGILGRNIFLFDRTKNCLLRDAWMYDKYDDCGEGWLSDFLTGRFTLPENPKVEGVRSLFGSPDSDQSDWCYACKTDIKLIEQR